MQQISNLLGGGSTPLVSTIIFKYKQSNINTMIKFPRISHFPFSPQAVANQSRDDKIGIKGWDKYLRRHGYVTFEKMDGSNVCLTREGVFPRGSGVLAPETYDWLKAEHNKIKHKIPTNYRIYGENMYAVHSVEYKELKSYFYMFAVFDMEYLRWLSPLKMSDIAMGIGFPTSIKSFGGLWEHTGATMEKDFEREYRVTTTRDDEYQRDMEGWVVWTNYDIPVHMFDKMVFKWVREGHVQTDEHWTRKWKKATLVVD